MLTYPTTRLNFHHSRLLLGVKQQVNCYTNSCFDWFWLMLWTKSHKCHWINNLLKFIFFESRYKIIVAFTSNNCMPIILIALLSWYVLLSHSRQHGCFQGICLLSFYILYAREQGGMWKKTLSRVTPRSYHVAFKYIFFQFFVFSIFSNFFITRKLLEIGYRNGMLCLKAVKFVWSSFVTW